MYNRYTIFRMAYMRLIFKKKYLLILTALSIVFISACAVKSPSDTTSSSSQFNIENESKISDSGRIYNKPNTDINLGEIITLVDKNGEPYITPYYDYSDTTITFLSHWAANDCDSIHMINYVRKYGGPQISFITAPYSECGIKLQSMILAGNSPDIYKVRDGDITTLLRQGIFSDLTESFDWNNRNWIDLHDYLDIVTYNGKVLIAPEVNSNYFIWYNKNIFNESATEDPITLYEKDQWTTDKFDTICKKLTKRENGNISVYGFGYDHTWLRQVFAMFDAQIARISDGHYVNTLGEDNISDAISYLDNQINTYRVTCPQDKALTYFATGKLAMLWYGNWLTMTSPFDNMNIDNTIDFVPAPKNSNNKTGYVQDFALGGHAIPIGSNHFDASVAFIEIFNYYKQTPELDDVSTNAQCEINNWSQEQFKRIRAPRYYDTKYSFNEVSPTWDFILSSIEEQKNWLTVREIYSKQIDLVIDSLS